MILEVNQLVLTPFGYGTITEVPPLVIALPGPPQAIDLNPNEIMNKLEKIENLQNQLQSELNLAVIEEAPAEIEDIINAINTNVQEVPEAPDIQWQPMEVQQSVEVASVDAVIQAQPPQVQPENDAPQSAQASQPQPAQQKVVNAEQVLLPQQEPQPPQPELPLQVQAQPPPNLFAVLDMQESSHPGLFEPSLPDLAAEQLQSGIKLEQQFSNDPLIVQPAAQVLNKQKSSLGGLFDDSPLPPKAPTLDPVQSDQANQLPALNSPEEPFPFANLGVVPIPPPPPPLVQNTVTRKPPFVIQLSHILSEALVKAQEIRQSRQLKVDDRMVHIKLKTDNVSSFSAPAYEIDTHLYLLVKTFYGNRNYYLACVQFNTQIKHLVKLVQDASCDNPKMLHSIRLIHPIGQLKEFKDHNLSVSEVNLLSLSQLLLIAQTTFFWDPAKKGKAINLSNNNCTANKQGDSDFQTVLGTLPMSSGRHYWELKIDKYVDEEDLFVGIARKEMDLYAQPITTGMFWGYIALCARKCGPEGVLTKYGQSAKTGDVIGVLLEFRGGVGTLSFYRNGAKCGDAFNNLTGTFYPAVALFYGEVQITLDPKAAFPIN